MNSRVRDAAVQNSALLSFLASYFALVVLGNILYTTPVGTWLVQSSGAPSALLNLPTNFTFGYWVLLLAPLVIVPALAWALTPLLKRPATALFEPQVEFSLRGFLVLATLVYAVVYVALFRSGAVASFWRGNNALEVIAERFVVLENLSFPEMVAIQSLSPFVAFYSFVSLLTKRTRFWGITAAICVTLTAAGFVVLNWKWPVVLFLIGLAAAVLMFTAPRHLLLKAAAGAATVIGVYLFVSVLVLRLSSPTLGVDGELLHTQQANGIPPIEQAVFGARREGIALGIVSTAVDRAPVLLAHAVNRMAGAFPYYYNIFTEQGPVCGRLAIQYIPGTKPCHPSYLVYQTLFPEDGYAGRGTSPAAPHITAYAFEGWVGAALGLAGMGLVVAFFRAAPLGSGPMADTWFVLGVTTGYHLSQVPGDEVMLYPTGIIWPFLLLLLLVLLRKVAGRAPRPIETQG